MRTPGLAAQSVLILLGWLTFGASAQAADISGAWAPDVSVCKSMFVKNASNISFSKDADSYGRGFIFEGDQLRGKMAKCDIKSRKQDGQLLHLILSCSTDVALTAVQFSLRLDDDGKITHIYPGVPELNTTYYRCSL